MTEEPVERKDQIHSVLDENIKKWEARGKRHGYANNLLVVSSIALSVSVTIAGIYGNAFLAATLSAILGGALTFQQIFPFNDMAFFYRVGVAQGKILRLDLDMNATSIDKVKTLEKKVVTLIQSMAQDIPRGQALHEAVQKMKTDIQCP